MCAGCKQHGVVYILIIGGFIYSNIAIGINIKVFKIKLKIAFQAIIIYRQFDTGKIKMLLGSFNQFVKIIRIVKVKVFVQATYGFKNTNVKFFLFKPVYPFQPYQLKNNNDSDNQCTDKNTEANRG